LTSLTASDKRDHLIVFIELGLPIFQISAALCSFGFTQSRVDLHVKGGELFDHFFEKIMKFFEKKSEKM
jgi:hypothetical protein